jgi:hypothetical protein
VNIDLLRKKMVGLQKVQLDGMQRQIAALERQMGVSLQGRKQTLLLEKEILDAKMGEIRAFLSKSLPEKSRIEKWLQLKSEMLGKVMETVTEVVESKTISSHLHHVESKPLDFAFTPLIPRSPHLIEFSLLAAITASVFAFSLLLIRELKRGFPLSLEQLKALKWPILGTIQTLEEKWEMANSDLDLLRHIARFSEGGKVIGLILGKGPDYSLALGENLARQQAKSIFIRCDFKHQAEETPGLVQVWRSEVSLSIRKGSGYDYVPSGGYTPFGTEIIRSVQFKQMIEHLKKNYDWVFLLVRSPLSSTESLSALEICDKAVVTIDQEQTEELTPFIHWGYDEECCRLTFIAHI